MTRNDGMRPVANPDAAGEATIKWCCDADISVKRKSPDAGTSSLSLSLSLSL
jgi:hypothetical protein